jgi:hypothetical protein
MAAYFWVGGTGTWSGTGNTQFAVTSGGVATALNPTNADTVTFDANSGTAATVTVTSTAVSLSTTINKADINLSLSGSPTLCTAAGACTLTAGTITLNTFTLTTGSFSSNNTNARTIAFGSGNITVNAVSGTVFSGPTSTNTGLTITGTAQVNVTGNGTTTRTVNPGNSLATSAPISFTISNGSDTITNANGMTFNNLTFTSGFTGTFSGNNSRSIFGNLTLDSAINSFSSGASTLTFTGTGSQTITTAGETIDCPITFNGVGGTWALQDALTSGNTRTCTLTNGTLNLNGYSLTTGIFSSSNSNTRTLAFATSESIVVTGSNTTVFNTNIATGLTVTKSSGGDGIVLIDGGGGGFGTTRTVTGASVATAIEGTNLLNYVVSSGSDTITFTGSCAYRRIDFGSYSLFTGTLTNDAIFIYGTFTLTSGITLTAGTNEWKFKATSSFLISTSNKTINNPITFDGIGGEWEFLDALTLGSTRSLTFTNGTIKLFAGTTSTVGSFVTTGTNQKFLQSTTPGTQATLSDASGTNSVSYLTIQDSNATGGATWYALAPSVDAGNNTGWIFIPTPADSNEITMRLRSFTQPRRF